MDYDFENLDNSQNKNLESEQENYVYPEKVEICPVDENSQENSFEDISSEDKNSGSLVVISKKMRTFLISTIVILVVLLSLIGGYLVYYLNKSNNIYGPWNSGLSESEIKQEVSDTTNKTSINLEEIPEEENQLTAGQVYEKAAPSVVGVVVYDSEADIFSDPIGRASGVVISEDGYIVTNSHVVGDSTKYGIKIVLNNSEEVSGKVLGIDKKTDLAVIKAEKTGLTKASFADSDQVKVGDWALAIGNPGAGDLSFNSSLTRGTISGLNRSLGGSQKLVKYIQTDAAINSGNSGGALLNMYGQVIGINSLKLVPTNYEGMGFAIPSNTVKSVVDSIIANGYVSGRAILGISGKMVSAYQAQIYNVPIGVIIAKINSDSDIGNKGAKTGDIIMKINDINVVGFDVLSEEISNYKAGDSVKLTIYRPSGDRSNYSIFDITVKLVEDKGETETVQSGMKIK